MKGISAYAAAKQGVLGLTKATALGYASSNVRVNTICSATTLTRMVEDVISEDDERGGHYEVLSPMGERPR